MLNAMRLPHGMDLASLGARLRVPLHGYVLSLLALVASLLLVWLYWNNARQRELKAVQAEFTAETDIIGELLRQRLERSVEHTSELQSLLRTSYAVFCLIKKITN